jgi:tetratricopeptide (TPR) repeat protein
MTRGSRARLLATLVIVTASAMPAVVPADPDLPVREPKVETSPAGPVELAVIENAESLVNAGLRLAESQQWEAAELAYRDAIRLRGEFPEAWNGLGFALRQQGRFTEAVAAYDEALRLRPRYPQALEYLGRAYVALGQLAEAREMLARLRALDPAGAEALAQALAQAHRAGAPPR